ncbi:Hypothetical protein, conserved [Brucella suis ATCC 23445]|uniref:Ribbon-helix-helix protein, CopG family n=2 Tax=Brucella suis TaxID=29461 RepID=B0CJA8_BRUSI|nr:Hypothetical protein, conserved [Brucella suis ATCC 23445]
MVDCINERRRSMRADTAMPDYILIRVFTEEKQALKELARKKGTSLSGLIRDAVLDAPSTSTAGYDGVWS